MCKRTFAAAPPPLPMICLYLLDELNAYSHDLASATKLVDFTSATAKSTTARAWRRS